MVEERDCCWGSHLLYVHTQKYTYANRYTRRLLSSYLCVAKATKKCCWLAPLAACPADAPGTVPTPDRPTRAWASRIHQEGGTWYTIIHRHTFNFPAFLPTHQVSFPHPFNWQNGHSITLQLYGSPFLSLFLLPFQAPVGVAELRKERAMKPSSRRHGGWHAPDVCVPLSALVMLILSWYSTPQRQRAGTLRSTAQLIWPFTLLQLVGPSSCDR